MTEMYKTKNGLNPLFMQEIFCENAIHYNLRNNNEFVQPRVKSVNNGTESVRFKGLQLWQCYHQRYEIRIRFVSLKQRSKIGTGEIVHEDYAELLFRIWAFYDKTILDFCFYTIFLMACKYFIHVLLSIICILKDYFVF